MNANRVGAEDVDRASGLSNLREEFKDPQITQITQITV